MATLGLLLINLGTPDEPTTPAVRRYLREFLSDPRVLDINPVGRALLLHGIILRTRPKKSAHAYRLVWDPVRGSPLAYHSQDLTTAVAAELGAGWHVELAMRYQQPSIADALARLTAAAVAKIVVLPLFPQYADSSTGTALARVDELTRKTPAPPVVIAPPFYEDPGFLDAFAARGRPVLDEVRPDAVLMSFHGLPERHIRKTDRAGDHCLTTGCCDTIGTANRDCYRAHAYATARGIASRLALGPDDYQVAFQSRLGRTPWIRPFTDEVIPALARAGKRRLVVFCPAFVADCLETLEEIGMRARADFLAAGGEHLELVPSLNASPGWVAAVAAMARRQGATLPQAR